METQNFLIMSAHIELWAVEMNNDDSVRVDYTIYEDLHESDYDYTMSADILTDFIDKQGLNIVNFWQNLELQEYRLDALDYLKEHLGEVVKSYLEFWLCA